MRPYRCLKCETDDIPAESFFCHGCNAAPIRFEVKIPEKLKQGAHSLLEYRIVNQWNAEFPHAELKLRSSLKILNEKEIFFSITEAQPILEQMFSFQPEHEGDHFFNFIFRLDHQRIFQAQLRLEISSGAASTQIINFTDARNINGEVVVGTEGANLSAAQDLQKQPEVPKSKFVNVAIKKHLLKAKIPQKRILSGYESIYSTNDRLMLQISQEDQITHWGLIAKEKISLGRKRGNEIVTRVYPPSTENNDKSISISGSHVKLTFAEHGIEVKDNSTNGTKVDGMSLDRSNRLLNQKFKLELADVFSLEAIPYRPRTEQWNAYETFSQRYFGESLPEQQGIFQSLHLMRQDILNQSEQYLWFQKSIRIGRSSECEISINHSSLALNHAKIFNISGNFWIEAIQLQKPTIFNGMNLPQHTLAPLLPDSLIYLGEVEVTVAEFHQKYLDTAF